MRDAVGGTVDGHGDLIVRTASNAGSREVALFTSSGNLELAGGRVASNAAGAFTWESGAARERHRVGAADGHLRPRRIGHVRQVGGGCAGRGDPAHVHVSR